MNATIQQLEKQMYELSTKLAAARRAAAPEPVQDYEFKTLDGPIRLSELFNGRNELIVVHNMGKGCSYCTLWADGLNGFARPLNDRAAFVVMSPDAPVVQKEFADSREWKFRLVSYGESDFAKDMGFEKSGGSFHPGVSAFRKNDDGSIVRTGFASFGRGDQFCSVWHLFDLLGSSHDDWAPKYDYA
ncbi:MAG: DUF899 family protein [Phycisphaerae bacterium]